MKKLNYSGFAHYVLILLSVVVVAIAGTAYLVASHADTPQTAQFTGTITADNCATSKAPLGDTGCSIKVGTRVVAVRQGSIGQTQPWGQLVNFNSFRINYIGSTVQVFAAKVNSTHFTLKGSAAYYMKLVTAQFTGTITADNCATSKAPLGDVGCSITVGSTVVAVRHGNIRQTQPWGQLINFSSMLTNYTGRLAQVNAAVTDSTHATLQGSAAYYVKLLSP